MNSDRKQLDPEIFHDYVDNQLDPETRLEVARHIGENPLDAAMVEAYRDQNEALQRLYGSMAEEPVPQRLLDVIEKARRKDEARRAPAPRTRRGWRGAWAAALAVALALGVGGVAGWWGRGVQEAGYARRFVLNSFLDQAVQSYTLYAGSVEQPVEAPISDARKFVEWFKDQLKVQVLAPQLDAAGFKLMGARILPTAFGTAGQLVYADQDGRRVAVYVQVTAAGGGMLSGPAAQFGGKAAYAYQDKLSVYYWAVDNVAYALVAPLDQSALGELMKKILNPTDDAKTSPPPPTSGGSKTRV